MRVLITGGRGYGELMPDGDRFRVLREIETVRRTLRRIHEETPITLLIHGAAKGADRHAGDWACIHHIEEKPFPVTEAEWKRSGRAAGPMRNQRMLREGRPDLVLAFPGGRGTTDMVKQARAAGVPVQEVNR